MKQCIICVAITALVVSFPLTALAKKNGIPFRVQALEDQSVQTGEGLEEQQIKLHEISLDVGRLQLGQEILDERVLDIERGLSVIPSKLVFVTSQGYSGNLGGLDGADSKCQAAANEAGLNGDFLAWLSTVAGPIFGQPGSGPLHRFVRHHVRYVRVDGVQVADHFGDLVDGTLDNTISVDEYGGMVFNDVAAWSSTSANGSPVGGGDPNQATCGNWTTDYFLSTARFNAAMGAVDYSWSAPGFSIATQCSQMLRLICVEQ